jgi:predicted DNA-binding protein
LIVARIMNEKIRITLDLNREFYDRLEELRLKVGKTKAGVIRDALQLYEDIAEKSMEGYSFLAVDKRGRSGSISFFGKRKA